MSHSVVVTPEAREDIRSAVRYFDSRRSGLGDDFADEILALLDRLGETPFLYPEVGEAIRAAALPRFGYIVYYRLNDQEVQVVAVLHSGRSSDAWQRRV